MPITATPGPSRMNWPQLVSGLISLCYRCQVYMCLSVQSDELHGEGDTSVAILKQG